MRYLYTTKPDEGCHEVEKGIYGRPVQTCDEANLRKAGWSHTIDALRGESHGVWKDEEEGREEERQVTQSEADETERQLAVEMYKVKFGKKPHHKMKTKTIVQKAYSDD